MAFFDFSTDAKKQYSFIESLERYFILVIGVSAFAYCVGLTIDKFNLDINVKEMIMLIRLFGMGYWLIVSLWIIRAKKLYKDTISLLSLVFGVIISYLLGVFVGYLPIIYLLKKSRQK